MRSLWEKLQKQQEALVRSLGFYISQPLSSLPLQWEKEKLGGWGGGMRNRSPQSRKLRIIKHYNTYFRRPNRCGEGSAQHSSPSSGHPWCPPLPKSACLPVPFEPTHLLIKGRSSDLVSAPWKDWTYPKSSFSFLAPALAGCAVLNISLPGAQQLAKTAEIRASDVRLCWGQFWGEETEDERDREPCGVCSRSIVPPLRPPSCSQSYSNLTKLLITLIIIVFL